jgi:hypothetical protein
MFKINVTQKITIKLMELSIYILLINEMVSNKAGQINKENIIITSTQKQVL